MRRAASIALVLMALILCAGRGSEQASVDAVLKVALPASDPVFRVAAQQTAHPTLLWGDFRPPLPTNAWWQNLVLEDGLQPIAPYPYIVAASNQGIGISYPRTTLGPTSVFTSYAPDWTVGISEPATGRQLTHHSPLVAKMQWATAHGTFKATFARGAPFQVVTYKGSVTPLLTTVHAILSINKLSGAALAASPAITANGFQVALNNGQTWLVYTSAPITLRVGTSQLRSVHPWHGTIIVAVVTSAAAQKLLAAHRHLYVASSSVETAVARNTAAVRFRLAVGRLDAAALGAHPQLLTCLLPHHLDAGVSGQLVLKNAFHTLRGPMACVLLSVADATAVLSYHEPLTSIGWGAPRGIDPDKVAVVKAALVADQGKAPVAPDPYFFGKQVAAMGRLALIGDELKEPAIAAAIRGNMAGQLGPWLAGTNADALVYDRVWGGVISSAGAANAGADFGNGVYNDHHFHYGYFLYAAAALGRKDAAWLAAHRQPLLDLLRDCANPSTADPHFPFARHMDWFEGHSWASGLTQFGDGRNQESTSEAVNAYYGVYVLGAALKDAALADWGRTLLAMEIRSARKYWQISPAHSIYPQPFAAHTVVGVLWSTKVDYATFFGANTEFIHCIQMLPFTPITEALLRRSWVEAEYPVLAPAAATASDAWKGYIFMDHAVIDKAAAWAEVQTLAGFDDGNTLTNALYWVATRP